MRSWLRARSGKVDALLALGAIGWRIPLFGLHLGPSDDDAERESSAGP